MCEYTHPPQAGSAKRGAAIGRRVLTSTTDAKASRRSVRSTRASTRSPGTAPETSTTCPSCLRDHPAAGGRLLDGELDFLSWAQHVTGRNSLIANLGQAERVADEPLERGLDCLRPHLRRRDAIQTAPARPRPRAWPSRALRGSSSAAAACTSPRSSSARRSRIAARASPRDFFDSPDSRSISPSRASTCCSNAGERRTRLPTSRATTRSRWAVNAGLARRPRRARPSPCAWTTPTARRQSSKRSRMSPSQNSMRTGRRRGALSLQPLAIPIDPAIRHGQRHAALRPPAHLLERRSHDAHEVAAVLPTEVGFELAAVFREVWHRATNNPSRAYRQEPTRDQRTPSRWTR